MFAHRQNISHAINPSAIPTKTGCFQWESPIETWSVFTPLWVPSGKPLDLPCQNPRKPSNFKCQRHLIKIPSNIKLYGGGNFDSIPCYVYVCIYIYISYILLISPWSCWNHDHVCCFNSHQKRVVGEPEYSHYAQIIPPIVVGWIPISSYLNHHDRIKTSH